MKRKPACDGCYRRKIQCDSPDPGVAACNWCLHHDLACTFQRVRGRKAMSERTNRRSTVPMNPTRPLRPVMATPPSQIMPSLLPGTVKACTETLPDKMSLSVSITPPETPCDNGEVTETPSFSDGMPAEYHIPIHFDGVYMGKATPGNRALRLSEDGHNWILSRTGESVSSVLFETTEEIPRLSSPQSRAENMPIDPNRPLPPREMVEGLLEVYAASAGPLIFPTVDPILFKETLDLAYQDPGMPPEPRILAEKASVWAFVALLYIFRNRLGIQPPVDGDACADIAQGLLIVTCKEATIATLQTTLMLHVYRMSSSRLKDVLMLGSIACRSVFILGANKYYRIGPDTQRLTNPDRYYRQLRILFWMIYIFDKDIAIRTGQPPQLTESNCDLTLPDDYDSIYSVLPDLEIDLRSQPWNKGRLVPHFTSDPRISRLKGRVYQLIYSPDRLTKSDAQLLHDMRVLDDEIESWRMALPERFRPALLISENRTQHATGEMKLLGNMRHVHLQLEYHHLMALIHRASERYPKNAYLGSSSSENFQDNAAVQTSRAISVGASRSTLFYLKATVNSLAEEAFWTLMMYPSSAVMTIFFNILRHPLDPQTKIDLGMLKGATSSFSTIHSRSLLRRGNKHDMVMHGAASEMIRLAECAIAKAEREQKCHLGG